MTRTLASSTLGRATIALEFKLADLWVGAYYARSPQALDVWLCALPCLPLHVTIAKGER